MSGGPAGRPVVLVTGLGPVSKLGFGIDELFESLSRQASGYAAGPAEGAGRESDAIPPFDLAEFITTSRPYPNPLARCALAAGAVALDDAYVLEDEMDPPRCGLAVASALGDPKREPLYVHAARGRGVDLAMPGEPADGRLGPPADAMAAELNLRGYQWNLCGDLLCGAQAMEAAWTALSNDRADLMLAGGVDVPGPAALGELRLGAAGPVPLAQGAAILALETQSALERREGYAFCELGAVLCRSTEGRRSPGGLAELLRRTIEEAIAESGIWEGDVGAVFVCSGGTFFPPARDAERLALSAFSQVPMSTAKTFVGETFAAGFPMECALAAEVLNSGELPPRLVQMGTRQGVEFWMRRENEALLGFAALVAGCTADMVAAAVLKSI